MICIFVMSAPNSVEALCMCLRSSFNNSIRISTFIPLQRLRGIASCFNSWKFLNWSIFIFYVSSHVNIWNVCSAGLLWLSPSRMRHEPNVQHRESSPPFPRISSSAARHIALKLICTPPPARWWRHSTSPLLIIEH